MTDRQRAKDVKDFSELVKTELAKQGNYETTCNVIPSLEMHNILTALENAIHCVNFNGVYYNENVIELCSKLATQALILSCNSQRSLDAWNEQRA